MRDRREMPVVLMALLVLSWISVVAFIACLGLAFLGVPKPEGILSQYMGPWGWMPYLWIAGVVSGSARTGHRGHAVTFTRWVLLFGMAMGVVDLAMNGWARQDPSSIFVYSPWRFTWSWLVPGIWLGLLQSSRVRGWVAAEVLQGPEARTGTPRP